MDSMDTDIQNESYEYIIYMLFKYKWPKLPQIAIDDLLITQITEDSRNFG